MSAPWAVAVAGIFVWVGMVVAISFIETPLKFRAPGVTLQIGLGIGRLVFRALNAAELLLGLVVVLALSFDPPPARVVVSVSVAIAALAIQLLTVRPMLTRRSDTVLAGEGASRRSRGHYAYVGLELIKVIALVLTGILLLTS